MTPRPPRSTLFPYTTLFRSVDRRATALRAQELLGCVASPAQHEIVSRQHTQKWHEGRTDRKSTRLNSSHANISYAVFCLKKKNNKLTRTGARLDIHESNHIR